MPCLLRLDTIIVKRSPICCSSAQTYGLVGQFGLNVDSPNITCYSCASLIACSTRLHLLLICIYISSLQQTVSTHQGQTDNCIGCNVKFNLETNPYSNGPKVKVNLTAGAYWSKQWQLAEGGLQSLSWLSQNSWRQKEETVELESEELLETVGNYQSPQSVHARGVNQIEECSWVENETQLLLDVCEAILFPMDDLQLAFSNVPTIFTA